MTLNPAMTREEILNAVRGSRDVMHAKLLVLEIALAAELYPQEIKNALATVFDLSCVEEQTRAVMTKIRGIGLEAFELRREVQELRSLVRLQRKQIDEMQALLQARLSEEPKETLPAAPEQF